MTLGIECADPTSSALPETSRHCSQAVWKYLNVLLTRLKIVQYIVGQVERLQMAEQRAE